MSLTQLTPKNGWLEDDPFPFWVPETFQGNWLFNFGCVLLPRKNGIGRRMEHPYTPRTQMTLAFCLEKALVLRGWPSKIEAIGVLTGHRYFGRPWLFKKWQHPERPVHSERAASIGFFVGVSNIHKKKNGNFWNHTKNTWLFSTEMITFSRFQDLIYHQKWSFQEVNHRNHQFSFPQFWASHFPMCHASRSSPCGFIPIPFGGPNQAGKQGENWETRLPRWPKMGRKNGSFQRHFQVEQKINAQFLPDSMGQNSWKSNGKSWWKRSALKLLSKKEVDPVMMPSPISFVVVLAKRYLWPR